MSDQRRDVVFVTEGQHDSGLFVRAGELVRPHLRTHRHAVVMLDADWEGRPRGRLDHRGCQRTPRSGLG